MAITYKLVIEENPKQDSEKTIESAEVITQTETKRFTIAELKSRIIQIDEQIVSLQKEKDNVLAKIKAVVEQLKLTVN